VIRSETVENDRADQGAGCDVPVRGIGGDHRGGRNLRGRQARRVPRLFKVEAGEEPVAERAFGPSRCFGRDRFGATGPGPAGSGLALFSLVRLLDQRLQVTYQLAHHPLRLGVSPGALAGLPGAGPSLALCLLAVAGASHDTSHGSVATDITEPADEASANRAARSAKAAAASGFATG
jgi:hypothetical protein